MTKECIATAIVLGVLVATALICAAVWWKD